MNDITPNDWHARHAQHHDIYNFRPLANTIMRAENWILDRIPPDRKLIVLMGENHQKTSHTLLEHIVIAEHEAIAAKDTSRGFAVGFEIASDYRQVMANEIKYLITKTEFPYFYRMTPDQILTAEDPDGMYNLICMQIVKDGRGSDEHHMALNHFLLAREISTSMNDIPWHRHTDKILHIDQTVQDARRTVEKYRPDLLDTPIVRSGTPYCADGINLSNLAIVDNALAHMERAQKRIYIQICGLTHMFGGEAECTYDGSLVQKFQERGAAVLPIFMDHELNASYIPPDRPPTIMIDNLQALDDKVKRQSYDRTMDRVIKASGFDPFF